MEKHEESEIKNMPDKLLHCLARTLQDEAAGDCIACLYCKYAFECRDEIINGIPLSIKILWELQKLTSVRVTLISKTKAEERLKGSWVEKYPDLLEALTSKSFDELQGILQDPDILQYADN